VSIKQLSGFEDREASRAVKIGLAVDSVKVLSVARLLAVGQKEDSYLLETVDTTQQRSPATTELLLVHILVRKLERIELDVRASQQPILKSRARRRCVLLPF
jgi:hypothetical protein